MRQWVKNHSHSCIDCGKPVLNKKSHRCKSCAMKHAWKVRDKLQNSLIGFRRGEHNINWKGGKHKAYGYMMLYIPEHPRANKTRYVFEHIVIWEKAHHQPLPDGWVVHHINGIRDDNRPQNLLGLPRRGHSPSLVVKEVQKRLREVEAELAQQRLC